MSQDINICDNIRNVDDLFQDFKYEKYRIIKQLLTNPYRLINKLWTNDSPILIDRQCLSQLESHKRMNIRSRIHGKQCISTCTRKFYRCQACVKISRIFNLCSIKGPYIIECGTRKNHKISIDKLKITLLKKCLIKCMKHTIGLDLFTNKILTTYYLDFIFKEMKLDHIENIYSSFICGDYGYLLKDYELLTMSQIVENSNFSNGLILNPNVARGIVNQLVIIFHILDKYKFWYGLPNHYALQFSTSPINYTYLGHSIKSNFTLKLGNLGQGGITILNNNVRLFNYSNIIELQKNCRSYKNYITKSLNYSYNIQDSNLGCQIYKLSFESPNHTYFCIYDQCIGYFNSSLNFYLFMIWLMSYKEFYLAIINDSYLYQIWNSMWLPNEVLKINDEINKFHERKSQSLKMGIKLEKDDFNELIHFISKFWLRTNCLDLILKQIK